MSLVNLCGGQHQATGLDRNLNVGLFWDTKYFSDLVKTLADSFTS